MTDCKESGCDDSVLARGLCRRHYMRWRAERADPCQVDGCEAPIDAKGLCKKHYHRAWRHGDPLKVKTSWEGYDRRCEVVGCDRKHFARGVCQRHYRARFPEKHHQPWNDRRRANYQKRRALKNGAYKTETVLLREVFARDRGICQLCGDPMGLEVWPHPLSASIDHIVPLSAGGDHTNANVQLAHLGCNLSKGNRGGGEQLRMVA